VILVNVFAPKLEKKQTLQVGSWMWAKKKKKKKKKKNYLKKKKKKTKTKKKFSWQTNLQNCRAKQVS